MTAWVLRPGSSASTAERGTVDRFPYLDASRREGNVFVGAAIVAMLLHVVAFWVPLPHREAVAAADPIADPPTIYTTPLPPPPPPEPVQRHEPPPEPPRNVIPVPEPPDHLEPVVAEPPVVVLDEAVPFDPDAFELEPPTEPATPRPSIPDLVGESYAGLDVPVSISRPDPRYPPAAISIRLQAEVVLEAIVAIDGSVTDVRLISVEGGPDLGFSEAAIAAVSRWRYTPGTIDGTPVAVRMTVRVAFNLR